MSDEIPPQVEIPVEPSLNGKRALAPGVFQQGSPGSGLVFVATISGITWIAGFIVITIWSIAAYLLFRESREGSRAGVDFIANGIYYGFPLGALLGLWVGTKTGLRLLGEPRAGPRFRFALLGGVIALGLVLVVVMIALLSESPIRLAGLPVLGPIFAIVGLVAPGVGVALAKAWSDRRHQPTTTTTTTD